MATDADEVSTFLRELKRIISEGRGLDFIPRHENNQTVLALGLTKKNVDDEILALSVDDYCQGPLDDRDRPGHVWVFGRHIGGKEIYIKLKIAQAGKERIAKCISFHEANHPLSYPLR